MSKTAALKTPTPAPTPSSQNVHVRTRAGARREGVRLGGRGSCPASGAGGRTSSGLLAPSCRGTGSRGPPAWSPRVARPSMIWGRMGRIPSWRNFAARLSPERRPPFGLTGLKFRVGDIEEQGQERFLTFIRPNDFLAHLIGTQGMRGNQQEDGVTAVDRVPNLQQIRAGWNRIPFVNHTQIRGVPAPARDRGPRWHLLPHG